MPILLCIIIIFSLWLSYEIRKSDESESVKLEKYLTRERESMFVRKKDMSDLELIKLPEDLPFDESLSNKNYDTLSSDEKELISIQDNIKSLSNCNICNLTGYSNTDLRYKYGSPNLDYLMTCDNNFIKLVVALNKWGTYLYNHNKLEAAKNVLEYAVSIKADNSNIYTTLAEIYLLDKDFQNIQKLKNTAKNLNNSYTSNSIIKKLDNMTV